jgi:hypothetical protein
MFLLTTSVRLLSIIRILSNDHILVFLALFWSLLSPILYEYQCKNLTIYMINKSNKLNQ